MQLKQLRLGCLMLALITTLSVGIVEFNHPAWASCDPPPETPKKPPKK